jgi:hypothetical protein
MGYFEPDTGRTMCADCKKRVRQAAVADDRRISLFFDRLQESLFRFDRVSGELLAPDTWFAFREQCQARERRGRDVFGLRYLSADRDNPAEGLEEACDGAMYAYLDTLKSAHLGRDDADVHLALIAAQRAYQLYEALLDLRAAKAGTVVHSLS